MRIFPDPIEIMNLLQGGFLEIDSLAELHMDKSQCLNLNLQLPPCI